LCAASAKIAQFLLERRVVPIRLQNRENAAFASTQSTRKPYLIDLPSRRPAQCYFFLSNSTELLHMPMYEFFCRECNRIYTFYSRTINTEKTPPCPKCNRPDLKRLISRFAVKSRSKGSDDAGETGETPELPIDESRVEQAIGALASEAEGIDENNPRQAATLMRRFSALAGLKLGDKMEDAIARMEAGEDPASLEQEMGDLDEGDLFTFDGSASPGRAARNRAAPSRDETLYEM
jgi:putative FmdB family regulatory protein